MKISILQEHLLKALSRTGRLVSAKAQLPILQNILIETEDGRIKFTATNLETTEVIWEGAKIEEEGGICVPAKLITEFVTSLPVETADLTVEDMSLIVSCGGFKATIPGVSKAEFPPVSVSGDEKGVEIEAKSFVSAIQGVLYAAATDEGRPVLTGVKIHGDADGVVFAATDGYRLSVLRQSVDLGKNIDIIVPSRALHEVVRVASEEKAVKTISFVRGTENQVGFIIGDTEIYCRLIEGEYPKYEKIIPKTFSVQATLDKAALTRAVKSAAIFARDNANIVKLHIEDGEVTVSANTPQVGQNTIHVEAKTEGDSGADIAFNRRFLTEFLANSGEDDVLFEMTGSLNAGVFKIPGDDSRLHVIMPVRVQS